MTIPTLVKSYEKKVTTVKLKKLYSTLSQSVKLSEIDNGEYANWNLTPQTNPVTYFEQYWKPYLKTLKICNTYQDCGYSKTRPWIQQDGSVSWEDVTGTVYRQAFILPDGIVVSLRIPPTGQPESPQPKVNIDLNGAKGPNKSGIDYFWFVLSNKGLQGMCYEKSEDEVNEICKNAGSCCATKIINDNWQIEDDYPW